MPKLMKYATIIRTWKSANAEGLFESLLQMLQLSDVRQPLQRSFVISLSIYSVVFKLVDLRVLVRDNSVHVTAVAETWLSENDDALLVAGSNFRVFRCDRPGEKSHGWGVLLLVRDFLSAVLVHSVALASGCELLCVDFSSCPSFRFITVYRSSGCQVRDSEVFRSYC